MSVAPHAGPQLASVREYLLGLQDAVSNALEVEDGGAVFAREVIEGERGGLARPRVLDAGRVFERAAVNFSNSRGVALPEAATARRPELAGRSYEAVSVSIIVHPRNPFVPTTHANFRAFLSTQDRAAPVWWFGGGYDLTPYYGFREDAVHWHRTARAACAPFGEALHARFKRACDEYFYLPHRKEPRGIGGVFFDDFDELGFERSFALQRSLADSFLEAYLPIVRRHRDHPFGDRERDFQLYRRGRYAEFNLVYDRGTRFGLQSGGRIESILASMPPVARWAYAWHPEPGSREAELYDVFLRPRDWASEDA
jgi:coproporphyrinogen III oxidase